MSNCSTCKHWMIIPSHESARNDRGMEALGYKNCNKDNTEIGYARFVNRNSSCDKYESMPNTRMQQKSTQAGNSWKRK